MEGVGCSDRAPLPVLSHRSTRQAAQGKHRVGAHQPLTLHRVGTKLRDMVGPRPEILRTTEPGGAEMEGLVYVTGWSPARSDAWLPAPRGGRSAATHTLGT